MASLAKPSCLSWVQAFVLLSVTLVGHILPYGSVEAASSLSNSRKLLATQTRDYTAFCAGYDFADFHPVSETPFTTGIDYIAAIDVCNVANVHVASTGEQLLNPKVTGTFTEETIPRGRKLSLHVEGSGVFATGAVFDFGPYAPPSRFLGVNPLREKLPVLSKEELLLVVATASFKYDLVWEMNDGTNLGDPVTIDYYSIFAPANATFLFEEIFVSVQGPLRPTAVLTNYPLGNQAIISQHQISTPEAHYDPFAEVLPSGFPLVNDLNFNVLSPDENTPRAAAIIAQIIPPGTNPPGAQAAQGSNPSGAQTAPGTCDPTSRLPNQCFNAEGKRYICCPAGCPNSPGAEPKCG